VGSETRDIAVRDFVKLLTMTGCLMALVSGCIHTGAQSISTGGPGKPFGVTSVTMPVESLAVLAGKAKDAVVTPVPQPGGFSGTKFRYDLKRQQLARAQAQAEAKGKPFVPETRTAAVTPTETVADTAGANSPETPQRR
jgi:hypothetical protein